MNEVRNNRIAYKEFILEFKDKKPSIKEALVSTNYLILIKDCDQSRKWIIYRLLFMLIVKGNLKINP